MISTVKEAFEKIGVIQYTQLTKDNLHIASKRKCYFRGKDSYFQQEDGSMHWCSLGSPAPDFMGKPCQICYDGLGRTFYVLHEDIFFAGIV